MIDPIPGAGYRLLKPGEKIALGDEFITDKGVWLSSTYQGYTFHGDGKYIEPSAYRRPIYEQSIGYRFLDDGERLQQGDDFLTPGATAWGQVFLGSIPGPKVGSPQTGPGYLYRRKLPEGLLLHFDDPDHVLYYVLVPRGETIEEGDEIWMGSSWDPCKLVGQKVTLAAVRRHKRKLNPLPVKTLPPLLWLDLETTGLDPNNDEILEIAMVATDENGEIERKYSMLIDINFKDEYSKTWMLDNLPVFKMHTENGLLTAREFKPLLFSYEQVQANLIRQFLPYLGRPMAGSNPSFDRSFLKVHMPRLEKLFHYRHFDMNTLYALDPLLHAERGAKSPQVHRAIPDLLRDIDNLKKIRSKA